MNDFQTSKKVVSCQNIGTRGWRIIGGARLSLLTALLTGGFHNKYGLCVRSAKGPHPYERAIGLMQL